jgi:hypothetical protein
MVASKLTPQKYLRLLRAMTGVQAEQYRARLARGYEDRKIIRNSKSGLVAVELELHDRLLGNFRCVLYPDGSVEGGKSWHGRINRWKLKKGE